MAYVQVPKDLTRVKTKFLFNLTKRQCFCFGLAAVTGIPFYLFTRGFLGETLAATLMILFMLPFFFFAMYEKDGRPLEAIIQNIITAKLKRPGVRPYRTDNIYAAISRQIYEREVLGIEESNGQKAGDKNKRRKGGKLHTVR